MCIFLGIKVEESFLDYQLLYSLFSVVQVHISKFLAQHKKVLSSKVAEVIKLDFNDVHIEVLALKFQHKKVLSFKVTEVT